MSFERPDARVFPLIQCVDFDDFEDEDGPTKGEGIMEKGKF